jgi:hypothetical protein
MRRLGQTVDWRNGRPAAGGDHRSPESQGVGTDGDGARAGEGGVAKEDLDAQARQPLRRVVGGKCQTALTHPAHHRRKVDVHAGDSHTERLGAPDLTDRARRPQDRLRGNATGVQAVAAKAMALDDRDARAEAGRAGRADEPRGAAADDDEVVGPARLRVPPAGRVNELIEGGLVVVVRIALGPLLNATFVGDGLQTVPQDEAAGTP